MKASLLFFCSLLGLALAQSCPDPGVNGFASAAGGTTGGGNAAAVTVTNANDLKTAAKASGARVIIVKGKIDTQGAVDVASDKTIRGQDSTATIIGGFNLKGVSNIIIKNLNIQAGGSVDTIASRNSHHVWYDHLNIWDAGDGLLDITQESDYQTVSWCKFWYSSKTGDHRLASLVGSGGGDHPEDEGKLRVTYHHNWWAENVDQRMPRVMYGEGHIYNNFFNSPGNTYCVGFGSYGSVLIQNNYFKDVKNPHQFMYDVYAYSAASGNVYDKTSGAQQTGKLGSRNVAGQEWATAAPVSPPYSYSLDSASGVPDLVKKCAGPRYNEAVVQDIESLHNTLKEIAKKVGLPEPAALQSTNLRGSTDSPSLHGRSASTTNGNGYRLGVSGQDNNHGPSCDNSPKISPEDENLPHVPIHSLYALTKLRALRSPDAPEGHSTALDDFIARGALRLDDAERLFRLYRDRLDPFMYGVGCKYQQLEELRRRSSILTAATLTVAALHDPQANGIYGVCSSEFRRLTERSMFDRRVDRDYLRAMCVASYWLSDVSWMLSGYAIRRAAECNLHNSYTRAIEDKSEEAADGARLWYILNICDQHLATLYGRPAIVQEDSSMQKWEAFLASPVANEQDKRLSSQVALLGIIGSIRELFGPDKGQPTPRAYVHQITQFNKELDHWLNHWLGTIPEESEHIGRFPRKGAKLHFHFAKLHLYSHIFRGLSGDNPIPYHFLDCAATAISVATSTINFILTDPDIAAGVVGMPSYLHCMTAFACMFLIKVAVKYGGDLIEPDRVWDMTTSLVRHFRSLPAGRWHLANLMAPGLERMAATLKRSQTGELNHLTETLPVGNGINGAIDPQLGAPSTDGTFIGSEGEFFFDYDMSFGLSPVFNFDLSSLNTENPSMAPQEFSNVNYQMAQPNT
ncbi:C6 transcription factor [Colletotrichum karsti]|uniref:C6 transcription factor n=1 Tax=Colletotrichum karsti TaxID=1095194 RepID=A0A9P6IDT3_9PEZI|nr:C6 transcription factor [Colletotrichum karsti]KAF9878706.1 C6 transcription factor [Colletotrichum karsti]